MKSKTSQARPVKTGAPARKHNGNNIGQSEPLLRLAARTARVGGWTVKLPEGRLTWSDEVCEIHEVSRGFSPEVEQAIEFYAPEWRGLIKAAFDGCVQHGTPYDLELEVITAKARRIWVRAIGEAERNDKGEIVRVQGALQDISETKRSEQEIARLANRLTTTLESITDAFLTLDREWRFTYLNSETERILQRSRADLLGKSLWVVFPEAVGTRFEAEYRKAVETNSTAVFDEFFGPLKMWLEVRAYPSEEGLAIHFRDISDLKRAEAFFRAAFVVSPVASGLSSPDGQIFQANPAFCSLLGYTEEELRGRRVSDLMHPDDVSGVLAARQKILSGESEKAQHERRYLHRDGHIIDCLATMALVRAPSGEPLYFAAQALDISDRKRAEGAERILAAELAQALDAIGRREQYFRSLIENAFEAVIILDANAKITYASPALESITGMTPAEVIGTSALVLNHPDDLERISETLARVLERRGQSVVAEVRCRHKDGTWRTIVNTATNLLADPAVGGIVVNIRDVTEEKLLAGQLRQAQKMEAVGQLAGGIAHDFNNLLTVIGGHSDFLLETVEDNDPRREDVEAIKNAGIRASGLTRQLLAFSRKQILRPAVLDLNRTVEEAEKLLRRLIGEDIEMSVNLSPSLAAILADSGQLEQVLINLAVNARDAMPDGGRLTIETSNVEVGALDADHNRVTPPGQYVLISIGDTGVGMDAETRRRIFEPFFTTKEPGKGTGLGLAMVYGIVKQSGGYIWVETERGCGTTFRVYFPQLEKELRLEEIESTAAAISRGMETILLVEDEDSMLKAISCWRPETGTTRSILRRDSTHRSTSYCRTPSCRG
jgi:PAS domain S-box-containing protein